VSANKYIGTLTKAAFQNESLENDRIRLPSTAIDMLAKTKAKE